MDICLMTIPGRQQCTFPEMKGTKSLIAPDTPISFTLVNSNPLWLEGSVS